MVENLHFKEFMPNDNTGDHYATGCGGNKVFESRLTGIAVFLDSQLGLSSDIYVDIVPKDGGKGFEATIKVGSNAPDVTPVFKILGHVDKINYSYYFWDKFAGSVKISDINISLAREVPEVFRRNHNG